MKMIADPTGRFAQRPFYEESELDDECERVVLAFLRARHGEAVFPIATDDLTVLIERAGAVLDSYADLSSYGSDIEGVSVFRRDQPPLVMISERYGPSTERRHRLTLAHEFCHVHFHGPLWAAKFETPGLLDDDGPGFIIDGELNIGARASKSDWMEWQAAYGSGAILMPASPTRRVVAGWRVSENHHGPVFLESTPAARLTKVVAKRFLASLDATRIRLIQLNILTQDDGQGFFRL